MPYFTQGSSRAFERLMQQKPGHDHYDSGEDGKYEECRTCRSFRSEQIDRFCEFEECPFAPGRMTSLKGGGENI